MKKIRTRRFMLAVSIFLVLGMVMTSIAAAYSSDHQGGAAHVVSGSSNGGGSSYHSTPHHNGNYIVFGSFSSKDKNYGSDINEFSSDEYVRQSLIDHGCSLYPQDAVVNSHDAYPEASSY